MILVILLLSLPMFVLADPNDLLLSGSIIGLHSSRHNRFVRMNGNGRMDASSVQNWNAFPSDWTWERFRVVDAGNGEIALHCPRHNRFVRMHSNGDMDVSEVRNWNDFPSVWTWERFRVVDAGNGEIALHSPIHNRFVRMNNGADMDTRAHRNYWDLPSDWTWERFRPVMTTLPLGSIIGLHSSIHNRFVRMNGNGRMDASSVQSWNAFPSGWTWERFRVVDVGNYEIALH